MLIQLPSWAPWVYLALATHCTSVAVTLYLHRCQAHGAVTFHPVISFLMRFWLWLNTSLVTQQWNAVHRKHHSYAEKVGDPHSPAVHGLFKVMFMNWWLYHKEASDPETIARFGKGSPDDWLERNVFTRLSYVGPVLLLAVHFAVFSPGIAVLLWVIQILWIPILGGLVNGIGHRWGYRNHSTKEESRNFLPIGILIGGEELHNNHHNEPRSPKLKSRWWEFDVGWFYIRILTLFRLAKLNYFGRDTQTSVR